MEKLKKLLKKCLTKEVILYIVFGIFTTIVNLATFYLLTHFTKMNENTANVIAIVLSVFFAYITNRKLVFNSTASTFKEIILEMFKFFLARLATMLVEFFGCMFLFYLAEKYNVGHILYIPANLLIKAFITFLVIVLNFFFSKFFAFRNKKEPTPAEETKKQ